MSVHHGFEGLKVLSVGKDGGWERYPVALSHGDKRIAERSGTFSLFLKLKNICNNLIRSHYL